MPIWVDIKHIEIQQNKTSFFIPNSGSFLHWTNDCIEENSIEGFALCSLRYFIICNQLTNGLWFKWRNDHLKFNQELLINFHAETIYPDGYIVYFSRPLCQGWEFVQWLDNYIVRSVEKMVIDFCQKGSSSIALPSQAPDASELMMNRFGRFPFIFNLIEVSSLFAPNLFHV